MCWSPASDNLAFVSSEKGKDIISIFNIHSKKRIRTLSPNVTAIFAPDWSPSQDKIVFCAIKNGMSDLFLYDLKSDSCFQLTSISGLNQIRISLKTAIPFSLPAKTPAAMQADHPGTNRIPVAIMEIRLCVEATIAADVHTLE